MFSRYIALSFLMIFSLAIISTLKAQLPDNFYDQKLDYNFTFPVGMEFDQNGSMYVWEKEGKVFIIDKDGQRLETPLIDISEAVTNWRDHGLMGFALDPEFLTNGYFYLLYAVDLHHHYHYGTPSYHPDTTVTDVATFGRLSRFTADPASNFTKTLPDSERILLGESIENGIPLMYAFHGLGSIVVGTDGTLLISCGDATSNGGIDIGGTDSLGTLRSDALNKGIITPDQDVGSYRAQYLGSLNGKVLRIDPETGDGLPSNPFYDSQNPRSPQSRIWALGFRNPYRIMLRPETGSHYPADGNPGTIYAGDVGNGGWEEINIIPEGGMNFGWPITEGIGSNWAFQINDVPVNQLAPNPLYGNTGCEEEFFNFRDLFERPVAEGVDFIPNPCDPTQPIPEAAFPMVESLPSIAWNNARWNTPTRAQVPYFNDEGNIQPTNIGSTESGVEGEIFDGFSSLAGVFYTGDQFPEAYRGKYFGVDFSGWIKVFDYDGDHHLLSVAPFHDNAKDIIHLALNPDDGCLYFVDLDGQIHKISYGGNPPPVAVIAADKAYGVGPLTVQFDASGSYDSNLPLISYEWDFGDGQTATGLQASHTFATTETGPKSYEVSLTVTDSLGETDTESMIISLNNTPPEVNIISFKDGDQYPLGKTFLLVLEADVADQEHDDEELQYEWKVFLHHNDHYHPEPTDFDHKSFSLISPLGCEDQLYWYRIELTVTDPAGLSTTDSRQIYPYCGHEFIEWTELRAIDEAQQITLNWETLLEDTVATLEVQRSTDFFHFETLAVVTPEQISQAEVTYAFVDQSPERGTNVYRIKAISNNRAFVYSNLATVDFPPKPDVQLFPNPAQESFTIKIKSAASETVELELFNPAGIRLLNTTWSASIEEENERIILTNNLANGLYYYRLRNGSLEKSGTVLIRK